MMSTCSQLKGKKMTQAKYEIDPIGVAIMAIAIGLAIGIATGNLPPRSCSPTTKIVDCTLLLPKEAPEKSICLEWQNMTDSTYMLNDSMGIIITTDAHTPKDAYDLGGWDANKTELRIDGKFVPLVNQTTTSKCVKWSDSQPCELSGVTIPDMTLITKNETKITCSGNGKVITYCHRQYDIPDWVICGIN